MSVRAAAVMDADAIAALARQLGYDPDPAAVSGRLQRILTKPDHGFFVADMDGEAVGWVHALVSEYVEADPFVVIGGLVVDRHHRRLGIGRLLMRRAEQWALAQGCTLVRLRSSDKRVAAHQFYRDLGYTHIKTQLSFLKSLAADGGGSIEQFIPKIAE